MESHSWDRVPEPGRGSQALRFTVSLAYLLVTAKLRVEADDLSMKMGLYKLAFQRGLGGLGGDGDTLTLQKRRL